MFIGIVACFLGATLISSVTHDVKLAGGLFLLVFGGCSIMTYRGTSLTHL